MTTITSIRPLLPAIAAAAELARGYYRRDERLNPRFKADATIVTAADIAVETLLRQAIADCFPQANILGEEGEYRLDPALPYTFTIDPIDGTAAFASGAPAWAICVGLLDAHLQPIAGIVSAPCWSSLFMADADAATPAVHNGTALAAFDPTARPGIDQHTTLLVDSKLFQTHYLRGFPGKCRCFGSMALHLCLVAQQRGYAMAHSCPIHVWDVAAAHALARRVGMPVQYLDGQPLTYADLLSGRRARAHIVGGHPALLQALRSIFVPALAS